MSSRFISYNVMPPPEPLPLEKWKTILVLAILYLAFLILTKGVAAGTAIAMASRKYDISEDVLRKAAKENSWL